MYHNKKVFEKIISKTKIYLAIIAILMVVLCMYNIKFIIPSILIYILIIIYAYWTNNKGKEELSEHIKNLTFSLDKVAKIALVNLPFPLVIAETNGNLIFRNTRFNEEFANIDINNYLKEILKEVSFDYIVASPLVRAYNTAQIVMEEREQEIFGDRRLMEQDFGIFEGMTYKEIQNTYPKELDAWNEEFSTYRIPKGESFADVRSRAEDFLRDIPSGRESKGEKMLIVAHKGTLGHLLAAMLKLPLDGYWNFVFEQGCYSVVDLEDGYAIIRKLNASILVEGEPASVKSVK